VSRRTTPFLLACVACLSATLLCGASFGAAAQGTLAPQGSMAQAAETTPCADATGTANTTPTAETSSSPVARWIGFYQPGAPQSVGAITALRGRLGVQPGVLNFYRSIGQGFTAGDVSRAVSKGCTPLITLEFCPEGKTGVVKQPSYSLGKIADGAHDAKIRAYARTARNARAEIWIRPFHEMNGDWYSWCGTVNGNTPYQFRRAWQHVRNIFIAEGATNVKFVWCPNHESVPNTSGNSIGAYWPGEAYVDYMALDGYNFSTTLRRVRWRSFADLYAKPYATLCSLSATRPIIVAETASVSNGGDKARWIRDMFSVIPQRFPRIVGICWYNSGNSGRNWPIESSSPSLQAFRLGVANGKYAPGLALARVRPSLSVRTNPKKPRGKRRLTLYGVLTPGQGGDTVSVTVTAPGHRRWTKSVRTNGAAVWSVKYRPYKRGNYYVKVRYAGDATRLSGASRLTRVRCR
jgi:hypothetical protein